MSPVIRREVASRLEGLSLEAYLAIANGASPFNSLVFDVDYKGGGILLNCRAPLVDGKDVSARTSIVYWYLSEILSYVSYETRFQGIFQGDDQPIDVPSVSWGRIRCTESVALVPDLYYAQSNGYQHFLREAVCPWVDRKNAVFWRGGTTGGFKLNPENVVSIPRYRLCRMVQDHTFFDCKIYNVVQEETEAARQTIKEMLIQQNLMGGFVEPEDISQYRYIVQIDGNANSWGFVQKLRLGCCILLVNSIWEHWHSKMVRPWEHYVPVASDLSDLLEKVDWCRSNETLAAAIGARGRNLALTLNFETEMTGSVNAVLSHKSSSFANAEP